MIPLARVEFTHDVSFPAVHVGQNTRGGWTDDDPAFRAWLDPQRDQIVIACIDRGDASKVVALSCYPRTLTRRYVPAGAAADVMFSQVTEALKTWPTKPKK